jgi:hypothetical protein
MNEYQLATPTTWGPVYRTSDMLFVTNVPDANADWTTYQDWVAAGNTADPFVVVPIQVPDVVVVQTHYVASTTSQNMADPGSSFVVWNTTGQNDATQIAIAALDSDNIDQGNFWRSPVAIGKTINIQLDTNAAQIQKFQINAVSDNTTWFTMDVTPINATGGSFNDSDALYVVLSSGKASSGKLSF